MAKERVFISGRLDEMAPFREAAERAIKKAGMVPHSVTPGTITHAADLGEYLKQKVKGSDFFVGLYGYTLKSDWRLDLGDEHPIVYELQWALERKLPCLCYAPYGDAPAAVNGPQEFDAEMLKFRETITKMSLGQLTTPDALYHDLLKRLTAPRIFISYSGKDKPFADDLYARLTRGGYLAWLNSVSIDPGETWHDAMVKGLSDTDVLILVVSPDAMQSQWVREEWQSFFDGKKPLIPLLYRSAEMLPEEVKALHGVKHSAEDGDWYYDLLGAIDKKLDGLKKRRRPRAGGKGKGGATNE